VPEAIAPLSDVSIRNPSMRDPPKGGAATGTAPNFFAEPSFPRNKHFSIISNVCIMTPDLHHLNAASQHYFHFVRFINFFGVFCFPEINSHSHNDVPQST